MIKFKLPIFNLSTKTLIITTISLVGLGLGLGTYFFLNNKNFENMNNINSFLQTGQLYNNHNNQKGNQNLGIGKNNNKYNNNFQQRNMYRSGANFENLHQCFEDFRNIAIQKNNNLKRMESHLDQIIKLSDKVNYDSSKLKFYRQQVIQHQKQYRKLNSNKSINQEDFFNQRLRRRQMNEDMRKIGSGINQEFNNLQLYLKNNFISGDQN